MPQPSNPAPPAPPQLAVAPPGIGSGYVNIRQDVAVLPTNAPTPAILHGAVHVDTEYVGVGQYSGGVRDKERHGTGMLTFVNGDVYNGEWDRGLMHGYGEYAWKDGQKYAGDWLMGMHAGRGFMTWRGQSVGHDIAQGARYTGSFYHGFRTGQGSQVIPCHGVYAGEWQNDKRAGRGTFKWDNGNTYDGEWAMDVRQGIGLFMWPTGRRFEGQFEKDFPRKGLLSEADGTSYAVTYDPNGQCEIERDPTPVEKTAVGRREYVGPHCVDAVLASRAIVHRVQHEMNPMMSLEQYDAHREHQRAMTPPSAHSSIVNHSYSSYQGRGSSPLMMASGNYIPYSPHAPHIGADASADGSMYMPMQHLIEKNVRSPRHMIDVSAAPITPVADDRTSVRAVGRPVAMKMKLALDFDTAAGEKGSDTRAAFETVLAQDLANATGLPSMSYRVKTVSAGSVITEIDIYPDAADSSPDPFAAAGKLAEQANDPLSKLRTGKLTRALEAISFPQLKPGPMTPVNSDRAQSRVRVDTAHGADCECNPCCVSRLQRRTMHLSTELNVMHPANDRSLPFQQPTVLNISPSHERILSHDDAAVSFATASKSPLSVGLVRRFEDMHVCVGIFTYVHI